MTFGEALPPDKKIEAVKYISQQDIGPLLIKHVIDEQKLPFASYGGHVSLWVNEGRYGITVYVWREDAA